MAAGTAPLSLPMQKNGSEPRGATASRYMTAAVRRTRSTFDVVGTPRRFSNVAHVVTVPAVCYDTSRRGRRRCRGVVYMLRSPPRGSLRSSAIGNSTAPSLPHHRERRHLSHHYRLIRRLRGDRCATAHHSLRGSLRHVRTVYGSILACWLKVTSTDWGVTV